MDTIRVWPQEKAEKNGQTEMSCIVEGPRGDRSTLWYRFPLTDEITLTERAEPYAIALLFPAMSCHAKLKIKWAVCPTLLRNLAEYSRV